MNPNPNVIVFCTDQQPWICSGLHGNPLGLMPNFDRLARLGTHVANSFTRQPVCGPARSCLQTGQYATVTDAITDNALAFLDERPEDSPFYLGVHYTAPHSPWDHSQHPEEMFDFYHHNCSFHSAPDLRSRMEAWFLRNMDPAFDGRILPVTGMGQLDRVDSGQCNLFADGWRYLETRA